MTGASSAAQALARQPVGQRASPGRDQRFQALGERIEAARGGDRWRARHGELRIDQRDPRDYQRAAQARLEAMLWRGKHGVGGNLRPGARRGGHRDAGHRGLGNHPACPDDLQVVQRITAVSQQHGHGLADVYDAAAADRGDYIGAVLAGGGDRGPD
jgi:hypothetical protein